MVLGWRAGLAIPVGLFLQAVLLGHGGISTLGVNACVMTLPALAAGGLFRVSICRIVGKYGDAWFQSSLVFCVPPSRGSCAWCSAYRSCYTNQGDRH